MEEWRNQILQICKNLCRQNLVSKVSRDKVVKFGKSRLERATKLQIKPPAKNGSGNYRSFCFWTSWWRLAAAFDGLLWNLKKSSFPGKVGRHLIDRISDWPNPRGFTKGVLFVRLNRYVQVDQMPFGQSEIRSIRVLWCGPFQFVGTKFNRKCFIMLEIKALFMWPDSVKICSIALKTCQGGFNILPNTKSPPPIILKTSNFDQSWEIMPNLVTLVRYLVNAFNSFLINCISETWLM